MKQKIWLNVMFDTPAKDAVAECVILHLNELSNSYSQEFISWAVEVNRRVNDAPITYHTSWMWECLPTI